MLSSDDALGSGVTHHIDLVSNLYFGIGSAAFIVIITTIVTTRFVERRLGPYDPAAAGARPEDLTEDARQVRSADEARGLRYAMWGALAVIVGVALLTAIPGAPLRNPQTGEVIGDSPFMDSLILIITIVFFVAGWCYGKGAGTIKNSDDVITAVTRSWASLAGLPLLFLLIAQFIAYFNFSHMPDVAAVKLGDLLEHFHIGPGRARAGAYGRRTPAARRSRRANAGRSKPQASRTRRIAAARPRGGATRTTRRARR